jgi:hypothetical protein
MALHEILYRRWHVLQLQIESSAKLLGNIGRHVTRPAFPRVEAKDADRVIVLSVQQVLDYRFQIGALIVGFPPDAAEPAEIVDHEIDILTVAVWHDRRRPTEPLPSGTNLSTRPQRCQGARAVPFWVAALTQKLMAMAAREPTSDMCRGAPLGISPKTASALPPSWGRFFV